MDREDETDVLKPGDIVSEKFNRRGELVSVERAGDDVEADDDETDDDETDVMELHHPQAAALAAAMNPPPQPWPLMPQLPPPQSAQPEQPQPQPVKPVKPLAPLRGGIGATRREDGNDEHTMGLTVPVGLVGHPEAVFALEKQLKAAFESGRESTGESYRAALAAAEPDTAKLDALRDRAKLLQADIHRAEAALKTARRKLHEAIAEGRDDAEEAAAEGKAEVELTRLHKRLTFVTTDLHAEESRALAARNEARSKVKGQFAAKLQAANTETLAAVNAEVAALLQRLLPTVAKLRGEAAWLLDNR